MKEKIAYALWACLYILCVGLSFVSPQQTVGKVILLLIELAFFVPGGWLLCQGHKRGNKKILLRLRIVSICSLALTLVFLVAVFLSVSTNSYATLFNILTLVSAPMLCSKYWALSWFLWACLLMGTLCNFNKTAAKK